MSLSMKTSREATRQKSFMSRVSSVLLPKKKFYDSKSKHKSQTDLLKRKMPSTLTEVKNDHMSISSIDEHIGNEGNEEPGYASVSDLNRSHSDIQKTDSPPPLLPSKNIDGLYAVVRKKETKETSCNTDELDFPVSELAIDRDQHDRTHKAPEDSIINGGSDASDLIVKSESSGEDIQNSEAVKKPHAGKSRSGRQSSRIHLKPPHKATSHSGRPHELRCSPHSPTACHNRKLPASKVKSAIKPLENSLLYAVTDQKWNSRENINKIKQKHQEEVLHLRQEMQDTDKENEVLRAKVASLLEQEQKWKQEMTKSLLHQQEHLNAVESNAELNRRIAKLEVDTKQEVKLLCQQINTLKHEKDLILKQLQASKGDHLSLQKKYDRVCDENRSMISVERHVRALEENKRFLEEMKKKHEQDINKLNEMFAAVEDEKNSLSIQAIVMKEEKKRLEAENSELKKRETELFASNNKLAQQLQDMKLQQNEALDLLVSLLRTAEEVMMERDAMLKKVQLQDFQNKLIHTSVIQHSINVGRLEEHITNLRKRMNEEIRKVAISKHDKELDYNYMKESYERQLDFLRRKILQKNGTLDVLGKEKRQLEEDLENLWEATISPRKQTQNVSQLNHLPSEKLNNVKESA